MQKFPESFNIYAKIPNLIIGFHGCTEETYNKVILEGESLKSGVSKSDWLGRGLYFWEFNLARAWSWAETQAEKHKTKPAVIGAIIDLGLCLNLTEEWCIKELSLSYEGYIRLKKLVGEKIPANKDIEVDGDELYRPLDYEVIEYLHNSRITANAQSYDSVRGIFRVEGEQVYPTAGIRAKSHIQICIRNPNCIKGYFTPLPLK